MNKLLIKLLCFFMFSTWVFTAKEIKALVPYYYFPTNKNLEKEALNIGKNAYQLLYFGQIKDGLDLAKLAVKINKYDVNLWLILSEAQIANEYEEDALRSLKKAEKIDPNLSEIYFAKSTIYLKKAKLKEAKIALNSGLKISPQNHKALFQLGNIYLMEKDYLSAIQIFDKAIIIKNDFWQAINNKGLAYFEQNKETLSAKFFEKAGKLNDNAEPILGLASCLMKNDINSAILLAKEALEKDPNYVESEYRKEQLWGEKLQKRTEELLRNEQLKDHVSLAKAKINKIY